MQNSNAVKTVYGQLTKRGLIVDGEIYACVIYDNIKRDYSGVFGFFNLHKWMDSGLWIVFQVVPHELIVN